jgi:aminoglycoside 2'-N-acetyltransferase I
MMSGHDEPDGPPVRRVMTVELTIAEVATIRSLLWAAFASDGGGFTEHDWEHAVGGLHFVLERDRAIVAHASVVGRILYVGEGRFAAYQGQGFGSCVMQEVNSFIRARFELGAMSAGPHGSYERLGWQTWRGPSSVRTAGNSRRTPDDDDDILVLPTPSSQPLDPNDPISCEWRPGDIW